MIDDAPYLAVDRVAPAAWEWLFLQLGAVTLPPLVGRTVLLSPEQKPASPWAAVELPGGPAVLKPGWVWMS